MLHEEFILGFSRLNKAFSVTNADEKAKVYFDELCAVTGKTWEIVVAAWIRKGHKFPAIADLLEITAALSPPTLEGMAQGCSECDGRGGVKLGVKIYRARCEHGEKFCPPGVKLIPITKEDKAGEMYRQRKELDQIYGQEYTNRILANTSE